MSELLVKICGITRLEDALAAQDAGADLIGFVFAKSSRRVEPSVVAKFCGQVTCGKVGVFVNEKIETMQKIARDCQLDFVQLHGDEDQAVCEAVGLPVIKAIRVSSAEDLKRANNYNVHLLLLDAFSPEGRGGTGASFDWRLLAQFAKPYILAGGLNPENVSDAVKTYGPRGVDASSSLESSPGIKDRQKIKDFVRNAKGAANAAR